MISELSSSSSECKVNVSEEITLKEIVLISKDYINFLWSKWWILLISSVVGGCIGYFYAYSKVELYKAELTFVLEEEKSSSGGLGNLAGQFGLDMGSGNGAFSGDNILSLMKSRTLINHTLMRNVIWENKQITLAQLYLLIYKDEKWAKAMLNQVYRLTFKIPDSLSVKQNNLLNGIYSHLLANHLIVDKLDKKTSIMVIKVTSPNAVFSKVFTESLADEVSKFYVETKTKKSAYNVRVLQKQVDSVKKQLNSAIRGFATLIDVNPNANPSRQILKVPSQRKQIDIEANKTILSELVKNLEISKISLRKETPLIQIIDAPTYPLALEKFSTIKGIVLGGIIFSFFTIIYLFFKKKFAGLMT